MFQLGAWDFAGGMVVHESAGFSALAALIVLGPRRLKADEPAPRAHSLPMVLTGAALLWFGWFGFNGGSALTIGGLATIAFVNTQLAPASAMLTWMGLEWIIEGKPTLAGMCTGAVAGLVLITPSAGFVQPSLALVCGVIGGAICFTATEIVKKKTRMDDACDIFGVHGVAGFVGTVFVGCLSDPIECQLRKTAPQWCANPGTVTRSMDQTVIQLVCAIVAAVWSFLLTYFIVFVMYSGCFKRLRTPEEQETVRDIFAHGEIAYVIKKPVKELASDDEGDEILSEDEAPKKQGYESYSPLKTTAPEEPRFGTASAIATSSVRYQIPLQGQQPVFSTYATVNPYGR